MSVRDAGLQQAGPSPGWRREGPYKGQDVLLPGIRAQPVNAAPSRDERPFHGNIQRVNGCSNNALFEYLRHKNPSSLETHCPPKQLQGSGINYPTLAKISTIHN